MYEGIGFQETLFWRLYSQTKEILEEQGGYLRPLARIFWQDGRTSTINMSEEDADNLQVGQFLRDLDHFCAKDEIFIIFVCFPLPLKKHYCCVLTGLEWGGGGIIRGIRLENGKAHEYEHDLNKFEEIFQEIRFEAKFYNKFVGRC